VSLPAESQTAFISYSREDSAFALKLAEDLKAAGAAVWLDQLDIAPGQRWAKAVQEALNGCPRMLVILSPASATSTNVDDEVSFALEEKKAVIPVLYRECKIPFRLRPFQYADFRGDYDLALKRLVRTLPAESKSSQAVAASKEMIPTVSTEVPVAPPSEPERTEGRTADQPLLEQERPPAAEQVATFAVEPLMEPKQIGIERDHDGSGAVQRKGAGLPTSVSSFLTRYPAWVKVTAAVCGILILVYLATVSLHWWTKQSSGVDVDLYSVSFANGQSGWAVGGGGTILHTEDGGRNWQSSGVNFRLNSVMFANGQSGWAVGPGGTILHTEDGGNWTQQRSGLDVNQNVYLYSVTFVNAQSGWAVGDQNTIVHTEDGGSNWTKQSSGGGGGPGLTSVTFANGQSGWAVGESGTIVHTEDGGRNWTKQSSGVDVYLRSVTFANERIGWAVGESGTIVHTEDGGRNWTRQSSGVDVYLYSVTFVNGQRGWAVGDKGTIMQTEDGGATWGKNFSRANVSLSSIACPTPRACWAVGHKGTILHMEE